MKCIRHTAGSASKIAPWGPNFDGRETAMLKCLCWECTEVPARDTPLWLAKSVLLFWSYLRCHLLPEALPEVPPRSPRSRVMWLSHVSLAPRARTIIITQITLYLARILGRCLHEALCLWQQLTVPYSSFFSPGPSALPGALWGVSGRASHMVQLLSCVFRNE